LLYNSALRTAIGGKAPDWLGRPLHEVWPALGPYVLAAYADQAVAFTDQQLVLPEGGSRTEAWFTGAVNGIRDQEGRIAGALCLLVDTTEKVLAHQTAMAELEHRRRLFDQTPSFIAALRGPEHVYELVNQAYLQLVGHKDIIGKTTREVLPELIEQGDLEVLDRVYRSGKPFIGREVQFMLQRSSTDAALESRYLDIVYQPIRDADGRVMGVLIEGFDVTERIAAEKALRRHAEALRDQVEVRTQDLRQAEEALHQAQKMEALGQLTGGIAHDFNNLLLGINGALGLAERRLRQGRQEEVGRFVSLAMGSASRATGLVHRLLAFARRQSLDPKPVRVGALISSMEDLLRGTIGENIELVLIPDEDRWPALCDPNQLESSILNLTINARDAMPQGGKITIASHSVRIEQAELAEQHNVKPGDYVCILVTDTGAGMTPEVLEHVFEPFFTTKPIGQGTGLGLPMIYGFARQSGGFVHIDSASGVGTTVRLYLPRSGREPRAEEAALELSNVHQARPGEVVLVVEDDEAVRQLVVEVLHELGYQTLEAADGLTGLEILQSAARLDLLISDIGLPGMSGLQMVGAARMHRPELRVLYMTAYAQPSPSHSLPQQEEREVIMKPFTMEALALRIRQIMGAPGEGAEAEKP
jgi:PAS domain S-box-containing protein